MSIKTILHLTLLFLSLETYGQNKKKVEILDLSEDSLSFDEQIEEIDVSGETNLKIDEIIEPVDEYRYSSFGSGDPFQIPEIKRSVSTQNTAGQTSSISGESVPIVSPLQSYPLNQLQVKGIWINASGQRRAVVMTPKKEGVIIKEGDPIAAGKVMLIERNQIKVRQYTINSDGSRQFKDVQIPFGLRRQSDAGTIEFVPGQGVKFQTDNGLEAPAANGNNGRAPNGEQNGILPAGDNDGGMGAREGQANPQGILDDLTKLPEDKLPGNTQTRPGAGDNGGVKNNEANLQNANAGADEMKEQGNK